MKQILKNIIILVIFNLLLFLTGYIISTFFRTDIHIYDISIASIVFSVIAVITIFVFLRGQTKEPDSQTLHTLVALSLKFLLELIFALLWFIVAKKTSLESVLIFFVLYLALSLFSIMVIVKVLKNKAI